MECLVDQEGQLEVDSLSHWKPVELPQHWSDMVTSTSAIVQYTLTVTMLPSYLQSVAAACLIPIAWRQRHNYLKNFDPWIMLQVLKNIFVV